MITILSEAGMATVRTGKVNYFRQLKMAMLYPGNEAGSALDRNNRIAVFAFAILPGLSPNFNSFILLASMVWKPTVWPRAASP